MIRCKFAELTLLLCLISVSGSSVCSPTPANGHAILKIAEVSGNSTPAFRITAAGNAFMCPFLTPIFIRRLQDAGANSCVKQANLDIIVTFPDELGIAGERIKQIAEEVGFDSASIQVTTLPTEP